MKKRKAEFVWLGQKHIFDVNEGLWLDLGCGKNAHEGFKGVDKRDLPNVEQINLEHFPWPWAEGSVQVILASQIVEHLDPSNSINFMNECHRILEDDGLLVVITPYGTSERHYQDPTHKNPWIRYTPFYFVPGNHLYDVYEPKQWKIETLTYNMQRDLGVAFRKIDNISPEEEEKIRKLWKYVAMAETVNEESKKIEKVRV